MWGKKKKQCLETGCQAPSFKLKSMDGATQSLEEILAKGPALLAFFKVACPVCQFAFPYLERMAVSSSLQLIAISQDDEAATTGFRKRFGITFPTLLDQSKEGYPASNAYGLTSVPSLFLVEKTGQIAMASAGFAKRDFESLGQRAGIPPFRPDENVPEWKSG
jgi:peroxiredoxin